MLLLTREEIEEITNRRYTPAQVRQLDFMGIQYAERSDGSLVVLRAHAEKMLGGGTPHSVTSKPEPNYEALTGGPRAYAETTSP